MATQKPFPYEDILYRKHHTSPSRAKMSMLERAAQFAPFAALTGYDAAIRETARLTGRRVELDESEKAALNEKLMQLSAQTACPPRITITHYVPDTRKEGGTYMTTSGYLKRIDPYAQTVLLENHPPIALDDILELSGADIDEYKP